MKPRKLLIIGVRRPCHKAALRLGHEVVLWSDGCLHSSRKKRLSGVIEIPFETCKDDLTEEAIREIKKYNIDAVLGTTESSVILASRVRRYLDLKRVATDVVERFHNKLVMKNFAKTFQIPVTRFLPITPETTADDLIEELKFPLVIKPVDLSGTRDVYFIKKRKDMEKHLTVGWIAESFILGRECSIESFVSDKKIIFQNITEYVDNYKRSIMPAKLNESTKEKLYQMNQKIIENFGIDRGMTHAEFYITPDGPLFGEIAMRPPGGYFMNLIERSYGFDPWEAFIQVETEEAPVIQSSPLLYTGVYLIHPGKGIFESVNGIDQIEEIPGVYDLKFRLKPGEIVNDRLSTGEDRGYIFISSRNHEEVLNIFEEIERTLTFNMSPLKLS